VVKPITDTVKDFFKTDAASGMLLMAATLLAILFANTPLVSLYDQLLSTHMEFSIGTFEIDKPLLLWINDGLMAIFFFLVGLELKREMLEGEFKDKRKIILPGIGAIGGMVVPALIYVAFNYQDAVAINGWAIPAATDIAFALGVLMLLGDKVPTAVKVFLTSLAVFDDIGAIVIIAVFYTDNISMTALVSVAICLLGLIVMNRKGVESKSSYILVGIIMWVATLKSGVHATLAGVLLAMFIPMRAKEEGAPSPLRTLEHDLHPAVAYFILPVFAFANAGLDLAGISMDKLALGVPMGIALGLFVGKQIGIFGFCWMAIKLGWTALPKGMSLVGLYATAALCGIGFTMSLFIGSLAFEDNGVHLLLDVRLGIILGSLLSGVLGFFLMRYHLNRKVLAE
jgi:NhaA family Na+:H+ antiporter